MAPMLRQRDFRLRGSTSRAARSKLITCAFGGPVRHRHSLRSAYTVTLWRRARSSRPCRKSPCQRLRSCCRRRHEQRFDRVSLIKPTGSELVRKLDPALFSRLHTRSSGAVKGLNGGYHWRALILKTPPNVDVLTTASAPMPVCCGSFVGKRFGRVACEDTTRESPRSITEYLFDNLITDNFPRHH